VTDYLHMREDEVRALRAEVERLRAQIVNLERELDKGKRKEERKLRAVS